MIASTQVYPNGIPEPLASYEIKHFQHGIAVFGTIPIGDFVLLHEMWEKQGYTLMDLVLPEHVKNTDGQRAIMVITKSQEDGDKWRQELDLRLDNPDWLKSGDTGLSSKTIFAIMENKWHILRRGKDDFTPPSDADDFGRCYRLLKRYPDYLPRMKEVVEHCPEWTPIVENWTELCTLFESEGKLDANGCATVDKLPETTQRLAAIHARYMLNKQKSNG